MSADLSAPPAAPGRRLPALQSLAALFAGAVFGVGLSLAGMTDPLKVLGFLDVAGQWDASLLFVLGGAVITALIGFRIVAARGRPLLADRLSMPDRDAIDGALVLGSALFGIGWGIGGYCPGPAIAGLGLGNDELVWFLPSMLAGGWLRQRFAARR